MRKIKTVVAFLLVATMLFTATGCANNSKVIMEYEGVELTSGMFSYGLSINKTSVLYSLTYSTTDDATIWQYDIGDGKTLGEAVFENFIDNCKLSLVSEYEFQRLGLTDSEANVSSVEQMYQDSVSAQGGEAELDVYLAEYGLNSTEMMDYYRLNSRFADLVDYYYGENGVEKMQEQDYIDYLNDNYSLVQHILYKNTNEVEDESTGESTEESMTEEELEALKSEVEAKLEQINNGEKTYEDFIEENADSNLEYLVGENDSFVTEFLEAAFDMEAGEIRIVETEYGFHMMRRVEINSETYAELLDAENYNYSTAISAITYFEQQTLYDKLSVDFDKIIIDEEELAKFDITTAPVIN